MVRARERVGGDVVLALAPDDRGIKVLEVVHEAEDAEAWSGLRADAREGLMVG